MLEERLLVLPVPNQNESYVRVHPEFRAIFTSNPQEYSGVHDAQDALSDRMVMIDVDYLDRETEMAITAARSGLSGSKVERDRRPGARLSRFRRIRPGADLARSIMIARVVAEQNMRRLVSRSALRADLPRSARRGARPSAAVRRTSAIQQRKMLMSLIDHHCGAGRAQAGGGGSPGVMDKLAQA